MDAWHCPKTISDHNAVFVVFEHHFCQEDSSCCIEHQDQEDVSEDLWQVSSEKSTPGEEREKKGGEEKKKGDRSPGHRQGKRKRTKASARFKIGYYQLQRIDADIFSSAPVYVSSPVSQRNTPN